MTDLERMESVARDVGRKIGESMPEGVGFALHMFTLGEGGWSTFVANIEREDHIEAMREFIAKAEAHQGEE